MIKCILIEDELPAQKLLLSYINKTSSLSCIGIFQSINQLTSDILSQTDLIFLDIELPGLTGLEFLQSLHYRPSIIITTAYRDYAIDAFENQVDDYLLKPFSYSRFLKALFKIQVTSSEESEQLDLFVYSDKTFHKIQINSISYIKAEVDYVMIYYENKKLLVQDSLNNWEQKLKSNNFIRIHRSYLINFKLIDKVIGNTVFMGNVNLPIGKKFRGQFFELLKSY